MRPVALDIANPMRDDASEQIRMAVVNTNRKGLKPMAYLYAGRRSGNAVETRPNATPPSSLSRRPPAFTHSRSDADC